MSYKNSKQNTYKFVDGQNVNGVNLLKNPYVIVGDARPSRTGKSLSMRIKDSEGKIHFYTILKSELERMFLTPVDEEVLPTAIREYFNTLRE